MDTARRVFFDRHWTVADSSLALLYQRHESCFLPANCRASLVLSTAEDSFTDLIGGFNLIKILGIPADIIN